MTAQDISVLIGAVVVLIGALGGGGRWLLEYIKNITAASALLEATARADLSTRLHGEIDTLRAQIAELNKVNNLYMRRIYQLENFIHQQPGIDIPPMDGWPPA